MVRIVGIEAILNGRNGKLNNFSECARSPALLLVESDGVSELSVRGLDAETPFRLEARDGGAAYITDSTFRSVHWPGISFFNVDRVAVVGNSFDDVAPDSLTAEQGIY